MVSKVKCVPLVLGPEGIEYVKRSLSRGKTLSRYALESLEIDSGRVMTWLPSDVSAEAAKQFTAGGKLPQPSASQAMEVEIAGEKYVGLPTPDTRDYLVAAIQQFLDSGEGQVCVMEESLGSASDGYLSKATAPFFVFESEVYFPVAGHDPSLERIRTAIAWTEDVYLFVGFMTSLPPELSLPSQTGAKVSAELLRILARRVEKVFVGVYDGESYIVWSRGSIS